MKCQKWQLSLAHQWAKRASTAKREAESGRALASSLRAKREISVLSAAGVFIQA